MLPNDQHKPKNERKRTLIEEVTGGPWPELTDQQAQEVHAIRLAPRIPGDHRGIDSSPGNPPAQSSVVATPAEGHVPGES